MSKVFTIAKWTAALGRDPQNFLGASWISPFLQRVPESKKRKWALKMLAMSPHYFFDPDRDDFQRRRDQDALEASFEEVTRSRIAIYESLLKQYLNLQDTVLDYGCGPGFMAKAVSGGVKEVTGIDISSGAVACARILNSGPNIEYHVAERATFESFGKKNFDTIYSYAVVQHVTDEILVQILISCRELIRPGGRLLLQIQLPDDIWRTESDWRNDTSVKGKLRFRYGLHCFGRTIDEYGEYLSNADFTVEAVENIAERMGTGENELESQRLIVARPSER
jgi:cyclopropane fatty-acyl-phospholipid synthase-like methyltransferase